MFYRSTYLLSFIYLSRERLTSPIGILCSFVLGLVLLLAFRMLQTPSCETTPKCVVVVLRLVSLLSLCGPPTPKQQQLLPWPKQTPSKHLLSPNRRLLLLLLLL